MKIVSLLVDSIRLKLAPLRNRVRKWTNVEQRLSVKIRNKLLKLMEIRPKNQKDYYPMGRWLVSKRLTAVLLLAAGIFSLIFISTMMPENLRKGKPYRTYKYNAIPLKYYKGNVEILGKSGYTAYIGEVKGGMAQGEGTLYRPGGSVVYEGAFSRSMFHGKGKLFYPDGAVKYEGAFKKNVYCGEGIMYRNNGTLEYQGIFADGLQQGVGTLYNETGQKIYNGTFANGSIPYEVFLGKTTAEVSELYTGKKKIYSFENMIAAVMEEIGTMYLGRQEEGSLQEEWRVTGIYVLNNVFRDGKKELRTQKELESYLGAPIYEGNTAVTWADAAALCNLSEIKDSFGQPPVMKTEAEFEDVLQVKSFDDSYEVYIRAYAKKGYRYLFFSQKKSEKFSFYLIEPEEERTG